MVWYGTYLSDTISADKNSSPCRSALLHSSVTWGLPPSPSAGQGKDGMPELTLKNSTCAATLAPDSVASVWAGGPKTDPTGNGGPPSVLRWNRYRGIFPLFHPPAIGTLCTPAATSLPVC